MRIDIIRAGKILLSVTALLFIAGATFVAFAFSTIYKEVKMVCLKAQNEYQLDCIDSLIKYVQSDKYTFRERNSAIWTLGQLADKKALPLLKSLYKGEIPPKEPLDETISQYELKKAITWCERGNVTSWMYRHRDKWQ